MSPTTLAPAASGATATIPWWLAPTVIAALITSGIAVATLLVNGRRARVDRQRVLFAEVLGDLAAYREFVYIVRRRRHDEPATERVRISTELSEVQRKLNKHAAVLRVEAPRVSTAFDELLRITRRIAGGAIRDAWNAPPITEDSSIHVDINLSPIDAQEQHFLIEVGDHLSAMPAFVRRWRRSVAAAARARRSHRATPRTAAAAKSMA
jgi:hypothetical protein